MEEASGVKGELAIKGSWDDLHDTRRTGEQIVNVMRTIAGIHDLGLFRVIGSAEPQLRRRPGCRGAFRSTPRMQDAIQTAIGGNALTQVLQGEQRTLSCAIYPNARDTREAIEQTRLVAPTGERVSLAQLCTVEAADGASEVYREATNATSRSTASGDATSAALSRKRLPGHATREAPDWLPHRLGGRIREPATCAAPPRDRDSDHVTCHFHDPGSMFGSMKWAGLILVTVAMAPVGGVGRCSSRHQLQRLVRHWFPALFGVSVQTGVIMVEYINQLRARGHSILDAAGGGRDSALPPDSHDHACRVARPGPGGHVAWHWLRLAAPICRSSSSVD
jgi:cobalt-zinc-cadmium resistance protein CzcA